VKKYLKLLNDAILCLDGIRYVNPFDNGFDRAKVERLILVIYDDGRELNISYGNDDTYFNHSDKREKLRDRDLEKIFNELNPKENTTGAE
jgi:hypothetical protein